MNPLCDGLLLEAWERGHAAGDLRRGPTMLSVACPESSREQWEAVGIPELNLQLTRLRLISFGSSLGGYMRCTECDARLEFTMNVPQVIQRLESLCADSTADWTLGEDRFSMRAASSLDLAAVGDQADLEMAGRLLMERCIEVNGRPVSDASPDLRPQEPVVMEKFNRLNQAAEITCQVLCPECGHSEDVDLDIARFLWTEVRHGAARLLRDVHELAAAYGWSEGAILGMTGHRRHGYLEMIRS